MAPPITSSTTQTADTKKSGITLSSCDDDDDKEGVRPILESIKQFIKENGVNTSGLPPSSTRAKQAAAAAAAANHNLSKILFNPISEWEEPAEMPFLTLYEIHRLPRPIARDAKERIQVPVATLHSEFCCPICLGYIKKTSIVMECLHRFCAECIEKCLRLGKKECPSCRVHIPSRRSLRPDPNFDKLIVKIYGDVKALEQQEETEIETFNKARNMNNAYAESRRKGMLHQAIQRRKKSQARPSIESRQENVVVDVDPIIAIPSLPPTSVEFLQESPLVNFILRKDPQENLLSRLDKEYLRTNSHITICKLKNFLCQKLMYKDREDIQIYAHSGEKIVVLNDLRALGEVHTELWGLTDDELILHYRIRKKQRFG